MSKRKLDLEEETLEVNFKGESHEMRLPSNQELQSFREVEKEGSDGWSEMYDFYESLGLPKDFVLKLTPRQLVKIMETAADVKN